jgi:hypothetical protein
MQADHVRFTGQLSTSADAEVTGNVSFTVSIPANKPLLIEPIGMSGNAWEVDHFVGSRLLGHPFTALLACFRMHRSSSCITYMKYDASSTRPPLPFLNFRNGGEGRAGSQYSSTAGPVFPYLPRESIREPLDSAQYRIESGCAR